MKRITLLLALVCAIALLKGDPQISTTVTYVTSTPVRVATIRTMANSLFVQSLPGNSNIIYVEYANPGVACSHSTAGQVVAELGPGTATQPGQSFSFPSNPDATTQAGGFDVSWFCTEGTSSDTAIVSYNVH